ncbi:pyrimidine 5'-nucleotidase [Zychaea mexicana]|uniref:pyrimidine 5'-nucleotidase n=1 Tax=Zychaea mexicana TaxID=64656 RepID=UPI0022FE60D7|nr:pyrimidine 5'-nucleotidase [Zychaea mexicana]KAI9485064.1 pyrimidine 5'-nucleotidase [Zychaea mexicana]
MTIDKPVFFFDCDNCLYHKNTGILQLMRQRIVEYMVNMGISDKEAQELRNRYFSDYGLALRGLLKHHDVDPLEYDSKVDGGLPLEDILKPDPVLKEMLAGLTSTRKWVFTNAYYPHAERCIKLLGIDDQFEGMTFADYRVPNFVCKPEAAAYKRAMEEAGVTDPSLCYLVDDSAANVDVAKSLGWTAVHVADNPEISNHGDYQIGTIHDLPKVLPELWKSSE